LTDISDAMMEEDHCREKMQSSDNESDAANVEGQDGSSGKNEGSWEREANEVQFQVQGSYEGHSGTSTLATWKELLDYHLRR
jgi:hypothetical protein